MAHLFTRAVAHATLAAAALGLSGHPTLAAPLPEPTVFSSKAGVLDVVMVAKPKRLPELAVGAGVPEGWVYEVCRKTAADQTSCPAGSPQDYGGIRLALVKGDVLKVRLVNRLPAVPNFTHAQEPGNEFLAMNPTNIHTHGLIVSPRVPTAARPTFGDYVFASVFNPVNGYDPRKARHQHGQALNNYIDYEIDIPANHPSGLFFVHPHVHGIALNQISAGLSALLTVGEVGDYACHDGGCRTHVPEASVRHIALKDTQILADGTMQTQQDPGFCDQLPASGETARLGACPGVGSFAGGQWFFTLDGKVHPTIVVDKPLGEVWRLLNSSGSVSYRLQLRNDQTGQPIPLQVLSVDGVSVDIPAGTAPGQLARVGGLKLRVVSCPTAGMSMQAGKSIVCATEIEMMPSSRVEVWAVYRDGKDMPAAAPARATATLHSLGYVSGATLDDGDNWPAAELATVTFAPGRGAPPPFVSLHGDALASQGKGGIFSGKVDTSNVVALPKTSTGCEPLPPGYRRRIYFGSPAGVEDGFGLGYQIIDFAGNPTGPLLDITPFDPKNTVICVPLAAGDTPSKEVWELVNTTLEDHNFHIHQTKFRVIDGAATGSSVLGRGASAAIMHDNIPVKHGTAAACDGSVAGFTRNGCDSRPVVVEISFAQVGEFVYHCHILEHEDGGMMARIQVVPSRTR